MPKPFAESSTICSCPQKCSKKTRWSFQKVWWSLNRSQRNSKVTESSNAKLKMQKLKKEAAKKEYIKAYETWCCARLASMQEVGFNFIQCWYRHITVPIHPMDGNPINGKWYHLIARVGCRLDGFNQVVRIISVVQDKCKTDGSNCGSWYYLNSSALCKQDGSLFQGNGIMLTVLRFSSQYNYPDGYHVTTMGNGLNREFCAI